MFLKKGEKVKVIVGKDKGKNAEIIEIERVRNLAKVKEVNMQKKHKKATKENKGGIITKEGFINLSNLKKKIDTKLYIDYLRSKLPAYMIPSKVKLLEKLPLNSNDKTDKIALKKMLNDWKIKN